MKYDKKELIPFKLKLDEKGKKQTVFAGTWKTGEVYSKADLMKGNTIGCRTGNKTFSAIDVDTKDFSLINEPFKSWIEERLEKKDGTLVETKNGYHFYVAPEHGLGTASKVDKHEGDVEGYVDIRGNGGLVYIDCTDPDIASYKIKYENGYFPLDGISDLLPHNDGDTSKPKEYSGNPISVQMKATDGLTDDEVDELFRKMKTNHTVGNDWLKVGMALYDRYEGNEHGFKIWESYIIRCYDENPDNDWSSSQEADIDKWHKGYLVPKKIDHIHLIFKYDEVKENDFVTRINNADKDNIEKITTEIKDHKWKNASHTKQHEMLTTIAEPLVIKRKELNVDKRKMQVGTMVNSLEAVIEPETDDESSWLKNIVYVASFTSSTKYMLLATNEPLDETGVTGRYHKQLTVLKKKMGLKTLSISTLVKRGMIRVCSQHEYNPNYSTAVFKDKDGSIKYNLFKPTTIPPIATEFTEKGLELIHYVEYHLKNIMGEEEANTLLDYLAYCAQNIGKKTLWCPLIQSIEGVGKSVVANMMIHHIFGERNAETIDPEVVLGSQTGWATEGVFRVLEEIKISGHNRFEITNKLKTLITNGRISRVEKYEKSANVPNFINYLALTNHTNAVPITDTDRRWWIVYCIPQTLEALEKTVGMDRNTYFAPLHELADPQSPYGKEFKRWMLDRDVVLFNPNFPPLSTHKAHAVATEEAGVSYLSELKELISENSKGVSVDVLSFKHLTEAIAMSDLFDDSLKRSDLVALLKRLGYQKYSKRLIVDGERYNLWFSAMGMGDVELAVSFRKTLNKPAMFEDLDDLDDFLS